MNQEETNTVIDWLCGGFNHRVTAEARPVWEAMLAPLDAKRATEKAIEFANGASAGDRFPTPADFRRAVRRTGLTDEPWQDLPPEQEAAEWVHIWTWMRVNKDWRTMPQQFAPDAEKMTVGEYEVVRRRWLDAGSPKHSFRTFDKVRSVDETLKSVAPAAVMGKTT